jgi:hypothetical protein
MIREALEEFVEKLKCPLGDGDLKVVTQTPGSPPMSEDDFENSKRGDVKCTNKGCWKYYFVKEGTLTPGDNSNRDESLFYSRLGLRPPEDDSRTFAVIELNPLNQP